MAAASLDRGCFTEEFGAATRQAPCLRLHESARHDCRALLINTAESDEDRRLPHWQVRVLHTVCSKQEARTHLWCAFRCTATAWLEIPTRSAHNGQARGSGLARRADTVQLPYSRRSSCRSASRYPAIGGHCCILRVPPCLAPRADTAQLPCSSRSSCRSALQVACGSAAYCKRSLGSADTVQTPCSCRFSCRSAFRYPVMQLAPMRMFV